ncbi:MAG: helix-turn-helix domain-containing protein [Halioglobus sp.]|nr:helix-turn-helix domain-containing protein [Halioglobus sp.]
MPGDTGNKHAHRSSVTRTRFIEAAQELFAGRSIDAVSLNEITVAAGQKNRNALQYHFGSRDGLLQAIIDHHAASVHALRAAWLAKLEGDMPPARAAARGLVVPLAQHIENDPSGVYYVKILSQLAALNSEVVNPASRSTLSFQSEEGLAPLIADALAHLQPDEARRRMFLMVSITFHGLADACRAAESAAIARALADREQLFEQVAVAVEALLAAPGLQT